MLVYLKIGVKVSKPISWIGFPSSYAPRDDHLPCLTLRESSRAAVYLHENFCESLGGFLTDRRTAPKAWDSWSKWVLLRFQAINLYAKSSLLLSSSHSVGKSIKICLILHFGEFEYFEVEHTRHFPQKNVKFFYEIFGGIFIHCEGQANHDGWHE